MVNKEKQLNLMASILRIDGPAIGICGAIQGYAKTVKICICINR